MTIKKLTCDKRKDRVSRRIRDLTPKEFVDWLIKYHGLPAIARDTVTMNLREQCDWHRIQGRLEANKGLADALDAFHNAAIGHALRNQSTSLAMDTLGGMAEGFTAVANQLREGGA